MTRQTLAEWIGDDEVGQLHIAEAFMELDTETKVSLLITMAGAALAYVVKINEVMLPADQLAIYEDRRRELLSVAIIEGLRACDAVTETVEINEKGVH